MKIKHPLRRIFGMQNRYPYEYHSQLGQDKWLIEEVFPGLKNGFFLEMGASDGLKWSNTYTLEKELGWNGISVEPKSSYFKEFVARRRCICENICIGSFRGEVDFVNQGWASGIIADFSDDLTRYGPKGHEGQKRDIVRKKVITSLDLLRKHKAPNIIHYFSLDVEGAEFEILKSFPSDQYIFLALTVEHNRGRGERNRIKREKIKSLLEEKGYRCEREVEFEDWYVHKRMKDYLRELKKKTRSGCGKMWPC